MTTARRNRAGAAAHRVAAQPTMSACGPMMSEVLVDGAFERVWSEERGTVDCEPSNLATVNVNSEQGASEIGQ